LSVKPIQARNAHNPTIEGLRNKIGPVGLEQGATTTNETTISETGGAKSGALADVDPKLADIVHRWPALSAAVKRRVWEIVTGE
jgi:hypothetical protein